nr:hypothetical protein [Tanacetum cinerariifolium]
MLPVALPSPDYVPGPEEPQTPPAPQDEDEHEPMFIQPHDLDFVPEPIYPEYIPLEDEHSDPEADPEEYEDDVTEDGPADYPMDEGDDGDDDDSDSSRDDADDVKDEEEEEEHLAPTNSTIAIPTVELVSLPEGTKPVIPPSSPDTTTTGARITRLARCTTPATCPSPPPAPSPLLPSSGCPTQIQALRLASTQALIDAVTAALPSPPLPPPLHMPPLVDCRDDIPKTEMPPRKRLCLSTLGSRDTWVDPTETVPEIVPMTVEERVDLLMEDRIAHQETIQIVEEEAYAT